MEEPGCGDFIVLHHRGCYREQVTLHHPFLVFPCMCLVLIYPDGPVAGDFYGLVHSLSGFQVPGEVYLVFCKEGDAVSLGRSDHCSGE